MTTELKTFLHNYLDTSAVEDAKALSMDKFDQNIYNVEGFHSYVQYRNREFQVQVFLFPPFAVAPEHTHPNVHSYEVGLSGDLWFSHGGKWLYPRHPALHIYRAKTKKKYRCIQVDNGDPHGAAVGPTGGIFLSVQQWLNGVKPSCVGMDYDGYGVSEKQAEVDGVKYKERTWKMAATRETKAPPWDMP